SAHYHVTTTNIIACLRRLGAAEHFAEFHDVTRRSANDTPDVLHRGLESKLLKFGNGLFDVSLFQSVSPLSGPPAIEVSTHQSVQVSSHKWGTRPHSAVSASSRPT